MPVEMRHILFTPAEVVQAVHLYHSHMGTPLPTGCVLDCNAELDKAARSVRFRFTIMPDLSEVKSQLHKAAEREVVTEDAALAAALLMYCHAKGIPMSSKSEKTLDVVGKKVCLIATINRFGQVNA